MSTTQRPFSLAPSPLPLEPHSPNSKKRPLSLQTRQPLGVLSVQVQSFQDRHRTQFAHLHQHSDDSLREKRLEAEKAELEAARRVGKTKRESVNAQRREGKSGKGRDGRRPLSLVVKQSNPGFGSGIDRRSASDDQYAYTSSVRPNSLPLHTRARSDAGLLSPAARVARNSIAAAGGLNVVVESDKRSETPNYNHDDEHSPDVSIAQSSYSWASQFSGETEELRTAARYISTPTDEGEEVLEDEDGEEDEETHTLEDGTVRRRKKIVALAHTVRQLEGVGSREAEDPAFYDTLVKAWNDRPIAPNGHHGHGQAQFMSPMTDDNTSPLPYTPNLSSRSRHSEYTPSTNDRYSDGGSTNHDADTSRRTNSLRYSYASTLHDLALEGGIEQANRIFLAKPWLRGSIIAAGAKGSNGEEFLNPPPLSSAYPAGDRRRISMAGPPALAAPIDINDGPSPGLRKSNKTLGEDLPRLNKPNGPIDFTASPEPSPSISDESQEKTQGQALIASQPSTAAPDETSQGWGLGFVNNWFAPAPPVASAEPAMSRSTTVAQFDDAPNDESLTSDIDAEGESDPEFDNEDEDQVFHDAGEGVVTNTNTTIDSNPPVNLLAVENVARPESSVMPSPVPSSILEAMPLPPTNIPELQQQHQDQEQELPSTENETTDSVSSNHYQQPPYSTPSITSYHQPLLAAVNHNLALNLNTDRQNPVLVERKSYEVRSARGSCHSSDSCSSPLTSAPGTLAGRRGSRPSLTPIITGLTTVEEPADIDDSLEEQEPEQEEETDTNHDLVKNLRDERFSSAFKLAQSLNVPTPTIKSPVRTSSINPNLHTSVLSLLSPSPMEVEQDTIRSNSASYFYQDSSDDMELMMGGGPAPAPAPRPRSASVSTSVRGSLLSPTLRSPGQISPSGSLPLASGSGSGSNNRLVVPNARNLRRPSLIELRTPTLGSISELEGQGNGIPMTPLSGTAYSISGESERLADLEHEGGSEYDLDSPSELPYSPGFSESNLSLTPSSPGGSYLRPPSISDSYSNFTSISGRERPTSRYQIYQAQQAEKSRKANAIVAAKMAGATPKELKALSMAQRSPNPDIEKADSIILPRPSTAAAVLFFIGFLGPWFWIIGGWWPLGHSSEIRQANQDQNEMEMDEGASVVLDFSGAEKCWRGWKWTYHPDPWVKRNRRAAAVCIPLLVLGGVVAAVVVALLL